ncbi:meiosis specific with OB domains hold'em isoform X2 [Tachypleus tridentatus]|uniref:meiosis specific with OB domains hold'em isoform X2 n=1 Tax=Tachypleus tridentatus TaxID=6853 RepID=UPI003FD5040E
MSWSRAGSGFDQRDIVNQFLQRISIAELAPNLPNCVVVGAVIVKQNLRFVPNRKDPFSKLCVLNFTLRDSVEDTINAVCWGNEKEVKLISNTFHIGDVVQLSNVQVQICQQGSIGEKCNPFVTSGFRLNISPVHSKLTLYEGLWEEFQMLCHTPCKAVSSVVSLADLVYSEMDISGEHINLLVGVRKVTSIQPICSKDGRNLQKIDCHVFDQTYPFMVISIWNVEQIFKAEKWMPQKTILFISDVKVCYNDHLRRVVATADNQTIFTENPDVYEAHTLYQYAQTVDLPPDDTELSRVHNAESLCSSLIFTITDIKKLFDGKQHDCNNIYGTLYCFLTQMDLDGTSSFQSFYCGHCNQLIQQNEERCINLNCPVGSGSEVSLPVQQFDIFVRLSDHSGSMWTRIRGDVVKKMFNCSVEDFTALSLSQKTCLKWKFLLERWKFYLKVKENEE